MQDKNQVELNLNIKFKTGEGRNDFYFSLRIQKKGQTTSAMLSYFKDGGGLDLYAQEKNMSENCTDIINSELSIQF